MVGRIQEEACVRTKERINTSALIKILPILRLGTWNSAKVELSLPNIMTRILDHYMSLFNSYIICIKK